MKKAGTFLAFFIVSNIPLTSLKIAKVEGS